jgi:hypothetical protein
MSLLSFMTTPAPVANPSGVRGGILGGNVGATPPDVLQPAPTTPGVGGGILCNIAKPIMGGVFQQSPPAGEWIAWTGGKPLLDWTGLDPTEPKAAPAPTMYRSSGVKDVKGFAHRIKGLETKFGLQDDPRAFQRSVMKHFRRCGIDTITFLPDPANPTQMESIVENANKFTAKYVMTKISEYEGYYDEYDRLNSRTASDFVLSSLDPEMERKVTEAGEHAEPQFLVDLDDDDRESQVFVSESF